MTSKNSVNISRLPTNLKSKIKDIENQIIIPSAVTNRILKKSKYTDTRNSKLTKQPSLTSSTNSKIKIIVNREIKKSDAVKKSNIPTINSVTKSTPVVNKILHTTNSSCNKKMTKRGNQSSAKETFKEVGSPVAEIAIQTLEDEILNHALIVGDLKIVTPSKSVLAEIDKLCKKKETKILLKKTRKFEEHSQKDEQHLDDLKEFLEKSFITRKPNKFRDYATEEDRQ